MTNGAAGQLGIAGVAPGSADYHGGAWAVNLVTFNAGVMPYLLTSAQALQPLPRPASGGNERGGYGEACTTLRRCEATMIP